MTINPAKIWGVPLVFGERGNLNYSGPCWYGIEVSKRFRARDGRIVVYLEPLKEVRKKDSLPYFVRTKRNAWKAIYRSRSAMIKYTQEADEGNVTSTLEILFSSIRNNIF